MEHARFLAVLHSGRQPARALSSSALSDPRGMARLDQRGKPALRCVPLTRASGRATAGCGISKRWNARLLPAAARSIALSDARWLERSLRVRPLRPYFSRPLRRRRAGEHLANPSERRARYRDFQSGRPLFADIEPTCFRCGKRGRDAARMRSSRAARCSRSRWTVDSSSTLRVHGLRAVGPSRHVRSRYACSSRVSVGFRAFVQRVAFSTR